ncbi:MAG: PIG-L deacetylase family protein, partial [archaeon]
MNVIAIGAHPDDIEFNCAGTLVKHIERGDEVVMISVSDGATVNHENETIRSKENATIEAKSAAELIGAELYILGYKALDIPHNHRIVSELESIINRHKADIVYTHWHGHTNQDHWRVSLSVLAAARCVDRVLMWEEGIPHSSCTSGFNPQVYIDITGQQDKKMQAIALHRSQMEKYRTDLLEGIIARARYRGYQIRKKYAECFELNRMV